MLVSLHYISIWLCLENENFTCSVNWSHLKTFTIKFGARARYIELIVSKADQVETVER